jgi:hypothetical protein
MSEEWKVVDIIINDTLSQVHSAAPETREHINTRISYKRNYNELSRQHSREEKLRVAGQRDLAGGVTTWWEE